MTTIQALLKRHPLAAYFVLTFIISWGGVLVIVGPTGIPATSADTTLLFAWALVTMLAGPSLSGLLLTYFVHGKAGLRDLLARVLRWRVGLRWYAIAILLIPLLAAAILFPLAITSRLFLPAIVATEAKFTLTLTAIAVGLAAGFFEELGWTGFAVPELTRRYALLASGLIVGLFWGLWHVLVTYWSSGDATGELSLELLLPPLLFYAGVLPAYRVLMVWVYEHSESLLVAMLMHASLTANTIFIFMPQASGAPLLSYYLVLTVALWIIVAAVAVVNSGEKLHPPLQRHPA